MYTKNISKHKSLYIFTLLFNPILQIHRGNYGQQPAAKTSKATQKEKILSQENNHQSRQISYQEDMESCNYPPFWSSSRRSPSYQQADYAEENKEEEDNYFQTPQTSLTLHQNSLENIESIDVTGTK
jgi:hypothetical protein